VAAVSDPAHITQGAAGDYVKKIQQALILLDGAAITADCSGPHFLDRKTTLS
jgi:hypothetical protein